MEPQSMTSPQHTVTRRDAIQAGALGLTSLSMSHVDAQPSLAAESKKTSAPKAVIYLFLSGGPSQHDTFDMKPDGPAEYKGEFNPIATSTPGIHICEHLPMLARRSNLWSLVRSLSHKESGHGKGTYVMLTGNTVVPPTFRGSKPQSVDLPSIAAIAGYSTPRRGIMPTSAILPEKIYHSNTGVYPGQFAGLLGPQHEPWLIECTDKPHAYHDYSGAFPRYLFNLHDGVSSDKDDWKFEVPHLSLQDGVVPARFQNRLKLLDSIDEQRRHLREASPIDRYHRVKQNAVSLIGDSRIRKAFDVRKADPKVLDRYGDNSFGWSLLMARNLVESGVNMVQVNMGNFGSWDLHGNNFPLLKDFLFPPTDQAVSALLDDLQESGRLENTLVVMAGEFGRTPRIFNVAPKIYKRPGRDHWAPCQSVLFAGGGVAGGNVIGSTDRNGAYPTSDLQTPENFAATIYEALGIPRSANWTDASGRPYHVYQANPIEGLMA
jgi:hypothetical protein